MRYDIVILMYRLEASDALFCMRTVVGDGATLYVQCRQYLQVRPNGRRRFLGKSVYRVKHDRLCRACLNSFPRTFRAVATRHIIHQAR